ncbi:MAG: GNAT family N-acetyltransferase [Microthrixaceae bacterium]
MAADRASRLGASLRGLRPQMRSAYVTSIGLDAHLGRVFDTPDHYQMTEIISADDPRLSWAPRWQRRLAAGPMERGEWVCLVANDKELDGLRVGHVWVTFASTRSLGNGMLNVNLRDDEAYVWDLFIHPEHRRESLGNAMGQALIDTFGPRGVKWGYTHVLMNNSSSVIWHHMFGFDAAQTVNCVNIGDRFWWKLPFSAAPRFGPLSRHGRHDQDPPQDPMGSGLLPPEWPRS